MAKRSEVKRIDLKILIAAAIQVKEHALPGRIGTNGGIKDGFGQRGELAGSIAGFFDIIKLAGFF